MRATTKAVIIWSCWPSAVARPGDRPRGSRRFAATMAQAFAENERWPVERVGRVLTGVWALTNRGTVLGTSIAVPQGADGVEASAMPLGSRPLVRWKRMTAARVPSP